ncbi:hypothetical protein FB451DRAFT_1376677 [Mycena latifolia]|nr:hypothetical protein FB451DRAFT_1376677 [Mycena latifolia]
MRHRRIVPRGGPLLRAVSEVSGCPPTDLDGYSLLDGNSDGPLTLCLYSLGIPCTFRGGLLQSNLSGNNNSCPENLLSGSEIGHSNSLSIFAPSGATISLGSVRLPISSTTKSPTTAASSLVAPVPVTSQSSTAISDDTSALISSTAYGRPLYLLGRHLVHPPVNRQIRPMWLPPWSHRCPAEKSLES